MNAAIREAIGCSGTVIFVYNSRVEMNHEVWQAMQILRQEKYAAHRRKVRESLPAREYGA